MRINTGRNIIDAVNVTGIFLYIKICDALSCMMIHMGKKYISSAHVKKLFKNTNKIHMDMHKV